VLDNVNANFEIGAVSYPTVKIGRKKVIPAPFVEMAEIAKNALAAAKQRKDAIVKIVEKNVSLEIDDPELGLSADVATHCDNVRYIFARPNKNYDKITDEQHELINKFIEHSYSNVIEQESDIDDSFNSYLND
jgi:hypothetical protein